MPTLSEVESKALLARHGVPVLDERLVSSPADAVAAGEELGFPVVAKLCGTNIAHKTERGLVRLGLVDAPAVFDAATQLLAAGLPADGVLGVLVAPMARGERELIAGVHTDPQFGKAVMVGIGGVLAETIADVSFRLVPLASDDALAMLDDLQFRALLGPWRGEPPVDRAALASVLLGLSAVATEEPRVRSIDVNPLIVVEGLPVAVDALVELDE